MDKFLFYRKNSVSVLLIGHMATNEKLIESAKKFCHSLYVSTCKEDIVKTVLDNKVDLIFGTPSFNGTSCISALQEIKKRDETIDIILFLQQNDPCLLKNEALVLKCNRYFCMETEHENALTHLSEGIHTIVHKNIFLKSTQYFDALLKESIVSQSDTKGNITFINDNFTKITGYTKEEVLGKNHRIMRHPLTRPEVFEEMWCTISKGNVWRGRLLNRNKDGSDFWGDTIIIPFVDHKTGKITQYIAIRRDITQMLQEQRSLQTKEREAQEQLKLSEAKDSFLILFTHELKTPLNAIINFSQYLHKNMYRIEEVPKEKQKHLLEQIYKSASSMLENVTNILDLSRLRNNKLNFNYTLFDLKGTIQEVIEAHSALAQEYKRSITFFDDGSEPYVTLDEHRFKQIIANVLSNAIKYGTTQARILLLSDSEKIDIIIEDDGKGIVDKQGVFELYQQDAKGLTSMEKKGTGIGLNFVKLLCEGLQLNYRIEDSNALGGTKFVLTKMRRE